LLADAAFRDARYELFCEVYVERVFTLSDWDPGKRFD
jgi:hypothetical protein